MHLTPELDAVDGGDDLAHPEAGCLEGLAPGLDVHDPRLGLPRVLAALCRGVVLSDT